MTLMLNTAHIPGNKIMSPYSCENSSKEVCNMSVAAIKGPPDIMDLYINQLYHNILPEMIFEINEQQESTTKNSQTKYKKTVHIIIIIIIIIITL
jgi:hypothetical protein